MADSVTVTFAEFQPAGLAAGEPLAVVTGAVVSPDGTTAETDPGVMDSHELPLSWAYTAYVFVCPWTGAVSEHEPDDPVTVQTEDAAVGAVRATRYAVGVGPVGGAVMVNVTLVAVTADVVAPGVPSVPAAETPVAPEDSTEKKAQAGSARRIPAATAIAAPSAPRRAAASTRDLTTSSR